MNSPKSAETQKVGVIIGDGFNDQEVTNTLSALEAKGAFIYIVSERLGAVTGAAGTGLKVDKTLITTSPYLLDALYIVGGNSKNEAKTSADIGKFFMVAYENFKPIGVATTAEPYITRSQKNNLEGVVFANNSPNFPEEFVTAVSQQRFWNRI